MFHCSTVKGLDLSFSGLWERIERNNEQNSGPRAPHKPQGHTMKGISLETLGS
jgi:hypothetical protein